LSDEEPNELMIEIKMMQELTQKEYRRHAALLAVVANQPELMKPLHEMHRERFFRRILSTKNPVRSSILFFATLGLHFNELLNLSLLNAEQRKNVYEELLRLAANEEAL
jgi:hypothetical protein